MKSSSTSSSSTSSSGRVVGAEVMLGHMTILAIDDALATEANAVKLAKALDDANDKKCRASCAAAKAIEDDPGTGALASIYYAGCTMNIERSPRPGPYPRLRLVIQRGEHEDE